MSGCLPDPRSDPTSASPWAPMKIGHSSAFGGVRESDGNPHHVRVIPVASSRARQADGDAAARKPPVAPMTRSIRAAALTLGSVYRSDIRKACAGARCRPLEGYRAAAVLTFWVGNPASRQRIDASLPCSTVRSVMLSPRHLRRICAMAIKDKTRSEATSSQRPAVRLDVSDVKRWSLCRIK